MRLDPLVIILDQDFKLEKKFYFISGNEKTFIERIKTRIIDKYKRENSVSILKIESFNDYVDETSLFENKKIILINNCKEIDNDILDRVRNSGNIFIFAQENSQKTRKAKNIFLQDKDSYLMNCYELDKSSKIKILNEYIKSTGLKIEDDVYWFLIEKLDSKYAFLENSLNKISSLKHEDATLFNIKNILTIDSSGKEKVLFKLYKNNKEIVRAYREKIITTADVNEFFYYCKSFCQLIIDSKNEEDYSKKIPVYLFKEKGFLIDFYRKYNSKKKEMLLGLLSSTEKILRRESDLSLISGLRFFLSLKKITIS
tara:strand:+ start:1699 stop:2637 length:939 start_codon:yes stop_codon:yes gene_type:complete